MKITGKLHSAKVTKRNVSPIRGLWVRRPLCIIQAARPIATMLWYPFLVQISSKNSCTLIFCRSYVMPCSRRCNNSERGTQSHFEPNAVWISVLSASAAGCVWSMGRNNRIIEGDATWKRLAPTPAGVHWDTGRNSITWNCRPSWPKRPQYPCCNVLCQMNAACFAREQASPVCTWQQYWTLTICQINKIN